VLVKRIDGRSFTPDDPAQDERVRRWCKSKEACSKTRTRRPISRTGTD
jgi:hypothetical protein